MISDMVISYVSVYLILSLQNKPLKRFKKKIDIQQIKNHSVNKQASHQLSLKVFIHLLKTMLQFIQI